MINTYPFNLAEREAECVEIVGTKSAHYLHKELSNHDVYYCSNDKQCAELTDQVSIETRFNATSFVQLSVPG